MKYKVDMEFLLGETKDVGGTITSTDGSLFQITSAEYQYCDRLGKVVSFGNANTDGSRVFIPITPVTAEDFQFVQFTLSITPLNQDGSVDVNRDVQTIIEKVYLNVDAE